LNAVTQLAGIGVPILGGDVWEKVGESFRHTYDSWYVKPQVGEADEEFLERSVQEARRYISDYNYSGAGIVIFEIVPKGLA
jgi:hypothetical protein